MIFSGAHWIFLEPEEKADAFSKHGTPSPYFRTTFSVDGEVKRACLYATAMGCFKAYINGSPVDEDYLSPGWCDYYRRFPYMCFDITDKIEKDNALGVVCGDGWAVGNLGIVMKRCNYFERVEFIGVVEIEYEDGRVVRHNTNSQNYKASFGSIVYNDIFHGEYVDLRKDLGDFSRYSYDDGAWVRAESYENAVNTYCKRRLGIAAFDPAIAPKITVKHVLKPVKISQSGNASIYDFEQNMTGVLRVVLKGVRGTAVKLRHAEMLCSDGSLYTENLRTAEAEDTVILAGNGEEVFRPLFTYHGFRYAEVTVEGEAEILSIAGEVMYTDLEETGSFVCSDQTVSKLYRNIVWGQRSNFLNVPTDCPQRDERLGWTADAQIFCGSAMYNMDCKTFYEKFMADVRDSQFGNGVVPCMAPIVPFNIQAGICYVGHAPSAGWADAITVIPHRHYRVYGDKNILYDNIDGIKRYMKYLCEHSNGYIRDIDIEYGDWLSIGETTDDTFVATLFFAYSARLTAEICRWINDKDTAYFEELFQKIRSAIRKKYMLPDGRFSEDTQTAYVLAYYFGVASADEVRPHLVAAVHRNGDKLTTGFLGVKFLLPVLSELKENDLAYKLITSTEYPSWGYSVANGATTMWERWNSYTRDQGFGDASMNSFNHYAFGSCCEWMFEYCLGIRPTDGDGAGFKKTLIRPCIDKSGKMTSASGHYKSQHGDIRVEWKSDGKKAVYRAEADGDVELVFDFSDYRKATKKAGGEYVLEF